ncbi:MAG: hypothetical protein OXG23_04185 [Chloroflexi bacterium]|nr:hypothetical protein [Chloroflexota bacterium]
MKRKTVTIANRLLDFSKICAVPPLSGLLIWLAFDFTIGIYLASNFTRVLMCGVTVFVFSALQQHIASCCLSLELRHWLRWTVAGVIVGALCHEIFTSAIPSPSDFWWHRRISPPPAPEHQFVGNLYHAIRWFFRFGLVAFFQYFALPRDLPSRRLWLLAAIVAAPLWHAHNWIAVIILALALDRIALRRYRFHFDGISRKHSQPTFDPRKVRAALSSPNSPAPAANSPSPRPTL